MEEEEKHRRRGWRVKIHSMHLDSIPSLWRFYRISQGNRETNSCCSTTQKLFLETLRYGKRVSSHGIWSPIEGIPKWNSGLRTSQSDHSHVTKDLIQTITSTRNSSRTYRSTSARHQTPRHPIWCPKMTPGYGDSPGAIHSPYLISQPLVHPDRPWQTYEINWKKCFF